jgi:hypothetical protein
VKYFSLPKTTPGKWSSGLLVVALIFLVFAVTSWAIRHGYFEFFPDAWFYTFIVFSAIASLGAAITGIIGISKYRERSIFVFIFTILGICRFILMLWTIK